MATAVLMPTFGMTEGEDRSGDQCFHEFAQETEPLDDEILVELVGGLTWRNRRDEVPWESSAQRSSEPFEFCETSLYPPIERVSYDFVYDIRLRKEPSRYQFGAA